jgi:hypothetical protein
MSTQFENNGTDITGYVYSAWSGTQWGQSFVAESAHSLESVKLRLGRGDATISNPNPDPLPGDIVIAIQACDGSHLPTGADLTSITYDGDSLPLALAENDYAVDFTEFILPTINLVSGTEYAIIVRIPNVSIHNAVFWDFGGEYLSYSLIYDDEEFEWFIDSYGYNERAFQVWGTPISVSVAPGFLWQEGTKIHWIDENGVEQSKEGTVISVSESPPPTGYLWFQNFDDPKQLLYGDTDGPGRRRITGTIGAASGQSPGALWVEGADLHGIDVDGDEVSIP